MGRGQERADLSAPPAARSRAFVVIARGSRCAPARTTCAPATAPFRGASALRTLGRAGAEHGRDGDRRYLTTVSFTSTRTTSPLTRSVAAVNCEVCPSFTKKVFVD